MRLARVNGKNATFYRGRVEHSAQFRAGLGKGPQSAMEAARVRAELESAENAQNAQNAHRSAHPTPRKTKQRKPTQIPLPLPQKDSRASKLRTREHGSTTAAEFMSSEAQGQQPLHKPTYI